MSAYLKIVYQLNLMLTILLKSIGNKRNKSIFLGQNKGRHYYEELPLKITKPLQIFYNVVYSRFLSLKLFFLFFTKFVCLFVCFLVIEVGTLSSDFKIEIS